MRFFLYTYRYPGNYEVSVKACVFGTKKDHAGLPTKVRKLKRGDIILIRDGLRDKLTVHRCCRVTGDVFDHDAYSPYRDFLWTDEQLFKKVIYPLRVPVDFKDVPDLNLPALTWAALDALAFRGSRGQPLRGPERWASKFKGNYVESKAEVEALGRLLGVSGV